MAVLHEVDVNLLYTLGAILEERNLTRAGERIGMTQPAVSGALARLRTHFGDELLIRTGREYALSPLAEGLLPSVIEALNQIEVTLTASREYDPATSTRRFTIAISDYALTVINAPLQGLLAEQAPHVEVVFDPIPEGREQLESHLLRRDLIIGGAKLGIPGQRQALFRDEFVCVVSEDNEHVRGDVLTLQEFAELPYASGSFGEQVLTPPDRALQLAEVHPQIVSSSAGLLALPILVSGTDLVAFVPRLLAERFAAALKLRIVDMPLEIDPLIECAHWHPMKSNEAGLQWMLGILGQVSRVIRGLDTARDD